MCGICGIFTRYGEIREYSSSLPQMVHLMRRRGPDDEGYWTDRQHVAFGFRRLSIIDLSPAGHQPMLSPCGRYSIVFNGELYNFRELRAQLKSQGVVFRSDSDTEVALQALAYWGEEALGKFNGMFALGWYDAAQRTLLLARDPMGIKPLYYLLHPQGLVFGSQYDQLLCHPFCDRDRVQLEVLSLYLRLGYAPAPYGIIKNTYQLEPGHYLKISPEASPAVKAYYRFPQTGEPYLTGSEAVEAVRQAAANAVKRQMVSDVLVGAFLSGGVDSPLVAGLMQRVSNSPVPAFTIGSTDPQFDESRVARAYAHHFKVEHTLRTFSEQDCLQLLDQVAEAYSEPFADYSSFPSMLLSQISREKVTVALSGDGGDELFWGYPRFSKVVKARKFFQLPSVARLGIYAASKYVGSSRPPRGILFETIGDWYFDAHSGLRDADLKRLCPDALGYAEDFHLFELSNIPESDDLAQWLRLNEIVGHLQMILLKVDRASMYYGLEVRVPLLDLEVAECAARINPADCMVNGMGKMVLRKVLASLVPGDTIPTKKKGFDVPLKQWLGRELRPYIEDLLLAGDAFPSGLFQDTALEKLFTEHLQGKADRTQGLWNLLSLQLWAHKHLKPQPAMTALQPMAEERMRRQRSA
jgi:asparagine synthase (glutamine-hydrolysing)